MNCNEIFKLLDKPDFTYEEVSKLHETFTSLGKKELLPQIILAQPELQTLKNFNYKITDLQKDKIEKLTNIPPSEVPLIDLNYLAKLIDIEKIVESLLRQNSSILSSLQAWIPRWPSH